MSKLAELIAVAGLTIFAMVSVDVTAQAQRWERLGSAHVDGRSDHDKIDVDTDQPFRALQMLVTNGAIGFEQIVVHFRNGGDESLPVSQVVPSGSRTRAIPLRGGARAIRNVEIWYAKGRYAEGKPTVQLFGRR